MDTAHEGYQSHSTGRGGTQALLQSRHGCPVLTMMVQSAEPLYSLFLQ